MGPLSDSVYKIFLPCFAGILVHVWMKAFLRFFFHLLFDCLVRCILRCFILQAGLFFLKHAEAAEKDLPAKELHGLLLLSLQWLSGMITQSYP